MFTPQAYEMHLQTLSTTPHMYFMEVSSDKYKVLYLTEMGLDRLGTCHPEQSSLKWSWWSWQTVD